MEATPGKASDTPRKRTWGAEEKSRILEGD
jgi:hypothetical protein